MKRILLLLLLLMVAVPLFADVELGHRDYDMLRRLLEWYGVERDGSHIISLLISLQDRPGYQVTDYLRMDLERREYDLDITAKFFIENGRVKRAIDFCEGDCLFRSFMNDVFRSPKCYIDMNQNGTSWNCDPDDRD